MLTFKRILVAVDGSENSMEACSAAGRLAKVLRTRIDVVHVVPRGKDSYSRAEASRMLGRACTLASDGVRAKGKIVEADGSVVDVLVNYASSRKSDLVIVGAKGSGAFRRLLLGSVSGGVVTHAKVPVLVVRSLASLKGPLFGRVLAAVDGSEASRMAVGMAAQLAKSIGIKLTILHVIFVPAAAYSSGSTAVTEVEKKARESAEGYLSRAKETAEDYGVSVKPRIVEDLQSPIKGITEYATREQVDLIVMGTRGLGGFKRLLLGSVARGVVSYAHCSVLVVRGG